MLAQRVALITGAGRGIGKAIAQRLSTENCIVGVIDNNGPSAEAVANEIRARGCKAFSIQADISNYSEVGSLIASIHRDQNAVHILINNAAILRRGNLDTVTEEDWDRVIAVNLKGVFNCCKHVAPIMVKQRYGRIVNITSSAAIAGDINTAPGYGPSKAGVSNLTKTLALELAPHGVTVNAVAPHCIQTDLSTQWPDEMRQRLLRAIPVGRLGKPEEVAAAVCFLVSDDAGFITGVTLDINGGALLDLVRLYPPLL